jgi:hypothetical protein
LFFIVIVICQPSVSDLGGVALATVTTAHGVGLPYLFFVCGAWCVTFGAVVFAHPSVGVAVASMVGAWIFVGVVAVALVEFLSVCNLLCVDWS